MKAAFPDADCQPDVLPFGPVLLFRGIREGYLHLAALFGQQASAPRPNLHSHEGEGFLTGLLRFEGFVVARIDFALRCDAAPGQYVFNGRIFDVETRLEGDPRIAFASCNGQEHGDFDRPERQRNAMWRRLHDEHMQQPFARV